MSYQIQRFQLQNQSQFVRVRPSVLFQTQLPQKREVPLQVMRGRALEVQHSVAQFKIQVFQKLG